MAAELQTACSDALRLLEELGAPATPTTDTEGHLQIMATVRARYPINNRLLEKCDSLVFTWTTKAGLGISVTMGQGFVIRRLGGGSWSAPCFIKVAAASAGLTAGYEKVSTLLVARSLALADELLAGKKPVLGADVSVQMLSAVQASPDSYDLQSTPGTSDLVSMSVGSGMCIDLSVTGGSMTVDEARNAACYGSSVTTHSILSGEVPPPAEVQPLYARVAAIAQGAH